MKFPRVPFITQADRARNKLGGAMKQLGVNIDHIATLREARAINDPNPLQAIFIAHNAGAHQITLHLREDRRHIHDSDVLQIIQASPLPINVECAMNEQIIEFLCELKPQRITLVPENRAEVTTEGGLELLNNAKQIQSLMNTFENLGVKTTLFIDPEIKNITLAKELGANGVELHTGRYANLWLMANTNLSRTQHSIKEFEFHQDMLCNELELEIEGLQKGAKKAQKLGLECFAGHGLNYHNLAPILQIPEITELNIGHAIIARAVFVGLQSAIEQMLKLMAQDY